MLCYVEESKWEIILPVFASLAVFANIQSLSFSIQLYQCAALKGDCLWAPTMSHKCSFNKPQCENWGPQNKKWIHNIIYREKIFKDDSVKALLK